MIRFYFKKGKWHVTSDKAAVNANEWWTAINQVKCMNHKLRVERSRGVSSIGRASACHAEGKGIETPTSRHG